MTRKAGSIVINRLRDRILLGRYFGRWRPGDRLPSVREVAELEEVDRKTAAAAYRRLAVEGVVRVEPRSGVYLEGEREAAVDPLRRLHLRWLVRALESAGELGLSPDTVVRIFQGVAAVKQQRIPVVDPDPAHRSVLARELSMRTGLECVPAAPESLPARSGPLRDPPFIAATPRGAEALKAIGERVPMVLITLAAELFEGLREAADRERVRVLVGTEGLKLELEQALDRGLGVHPERVEVVRSDGDGRWPADGGVRVVVWPGATTGQGTGQGSDAQAPPSQSPHLVAASTLEEMLFRVARAALEHVSTSTASATRG